MHLAIVHVLYVCKDVYMYMPALSQTAYDKLTIKQGWMLSNCRIAIPICQKMHVQLQPEEPSRKNAIQTAATGYFKIPEFFSLTCFDVTRLMTAVHK